MKITMRAWQTPNYVTDSKGRTWSLSELDAAVLHVLCQEFRNSVFKKAGIKDPLADGTTQVEVSGPVIHLLTSRS